VPRCLTGSRLGRRFYDVRSEVILDLLSDVLRVALDLADVPALHGRHEGNPDNERKRDPLSGPLRQQEVVVTGVEDVHGRTIPPTADNFGGRAVKVHGHAVDDKVPRTGGKRTLTADSLATSCPPCQACWSGGRAAVATETRRGTPHESATVCQPDYMSATAGRPECDGYVDDLQGQLVLFTGKTRIEGEHVKRDELFQRVRQRGGRPLAGTRNRNVTLLVLGELSEDVVTDPVNLRSQNVVFVDAERRRGNHICMVDDPGIAALLSGGIAPCLRSRTIQADTVEVSLPTPARPTIPRFTPLTVGATPEHEPTGLDLDLSGLDRGTSAHQATLSLLVAHLAPIRAMGLTSPRVDAAWRSPDELTALFVAEVKSLTGARQDQQVRLGIGQVLDYAHALRERPPADVSVVRPVLVLEREPEDRRWLNLADSLGILLTWAPDFPSLP
jgi:hypothetical protein